MLLCDTSGLVAYFDASDAHHGRVQAAVTEDPGPFVVSLFVLAELDDLLASRRSLDAELAALAELAGGAWELAAFTAADVRVARSQIERYRDLGIGLADASLIVLANRHATTRVLTLDRRHFHVLRTLSGDSFRVVPE